MLPSNLKLAFTLYRIADLLEIEGESPFKISAYRKAGQTIERMEIPIEDVDPETIPGIGKGITVVIRQWMKTGKSELLAELEERIPPDLLLLLRIPGLGPRSVGRLYRELGIDSLSKLEEAAKAQKIRKLTGFGAKTELNLLKSIKQLKEIPEEIPIASLLPIAREIREWVMNVDGIEKAEAAGDLRRMKETGKGILFVLAVRSPDEAVPLLLQFPKVKKVLEKGKEGVTVELEYLWPIRVDFRLVSPQSFSSALLYYTGSEAHREKLMVRAKERGIIFTPYGLEGSRKRETFATEEDLYRRLGISYIPPEIREGREEVERAVKGEIPRLIRLEDIRGDLHMHTEWSDGGNSIEEMARAAYKRGYRYIAITDHSRSLKIAGGLSIERLREQRQKIREVEKRLQEEWQDDSFRILAGVEMDILPDGRLDYPDEVLQELDLVIASVHTAFKQEEKVMMKRILAAVENNHVDIIAHPTGRLIGRRAPYAVNVEVLIKAAKETGTVLELNANPNRLDLAPEYLEMAMKEGVPLAINTDAHRTDELENMSVGVGTARRGWVEPDLVINTWTLDQLLSFLKRKWS
ncbi:DNA polymerase/3'-5' exonuclease PolX (Includes: DNA polymerase type-X; 3'-5' exodeoxyribonuclease) [[Clostridium] ultunense Esp]|nr:DNA polymerase/3'-5' exonuclease PolX (Includes: DNA polymerase type-X; 3'-5' exodeoxyribonuclease) [[Clostridium] ultunense Esp]